MSAESTKWKRKLALKVRVGFVFALLAVMAFYVFAPTDRSWETTKRELEARGEALDWEKMIPPPVPAENNLFEDPVVASLLPVKGMPIPPNPLGVEPPTLPPSASSLGFPFEMSNLVPLLRAPPKGGEMSLEELDAWFEQWDESFARLRKAGQRSSAKIPGIYSSPVESPIPNFVVLRTVSQVLASRAKVHLILGKSSDAFEDLETLEVVMKACEAQPAPLVSTMIRVAIAGLYLNAIEEGLRHRLWADAEIEKIVPRLIEINLMKSFKEGVRTERAGSLRHLEALANRKKDPAYQATLDAITSDEWTMENAMAKFAPASWVRESQARYARIVQEHLDGIDAERKMIDQRRVDALTAEVIALNPRWPPKNVLLAWLLPNFSKAADVMAKNQLKAHQLALACALERFRNEQGRYPAKIEELSPKYLESIPTDVFSGRALAYEMTQQGYVITAAQDKTNQSVNAGTFVWDCR